MNMTLSQATADLMVNLELSIATLIVGPVGVGKTDIVKQCADKLRSKVYGSQRVLVIDKRASQMEPTDLAVPMPDIATRRVIACLQEWLPDSVLAAQYDIIILFLDELTDAFLSVQAALNQLILDRELPGYRLPDNVRIVATGNRASDKAASQKVSRAMANRLAIMSVDVDVKAWIDWAIASGISPILIAYIQNADRQGKGKDILHAYPTASGSDAIAFPTPRSWARCDKYLRMANAPNDTQLRRLIAQNVGDDAADAFMVFLATYRLVPNVDLILRDPVNASIPREPSTKYAINVALVSRLTLGNLATVATYMKRNEALYQAAFWSLAIAKDESFRTTAEHVAFKINQSSDDASEAA
jgi:hypothetical protein